MQGFSETTFSRRGGFKGEGTAVMNQLGGKKLALASEAVKIQKTHYKNL